MEYNYNSSIYGIIKKKHHGSEIVHIDPSWSFVAKISLDYLEQEYMAFILREIYSTTKVIREGFW